MFMSKKRQIFPGAGMTCQLYTKEGQDCWNTSINSCGCEPGKEMN